MKAELDKKLVEDFPLLFRNRRGDMLQTAMCWGFEIGDGWEPLIREAAAKLEPLIAAMKNHVPPDELPAASQIKEKFGTLRFYLTYGTDEMYSIIDEVEAESAHVCELCGKFGTVMGAGWLICRCQDCVSTEILFKTIVAKNHGRGN